MGFDDLIFLIGKLSRLVKDCIRNRYLSYIMQDGSLS